MRGNAWMAEWLLASQEGLCSMELVNWKYLLLIAVNWKLYMRITVRSSSPHFTFYKLFFNKRCSFVRHTHTHTHGHNGTKCRHGDSVHHAFVFEGPWFVSRCGDRQFWLRFFISSVPHEKCWNCTLKWKGSLFLLNYFQLIVHSHPVWYIKFKKRR
jgi:hypothetical protein